MKTMEENFVKKEEEFEHRVQFMNVSPDDVLFWFNWFDISYVTAQRLLPMKQGLN